MLQGLKIQFKNANIQEEPKIHTEEQPANPAEVIAKKDDPIEEPSGAKAKMHKRKYDFSSAKDEAPKEVSTVEKAVTQIIPLEESKEYSKTIESLEQLRAETDLIWEEIKNRKLDEAGSMIFNLDTNISKWLYNLKSDATLPDNLRVPGQIYEGALAPPGFQSYGSQVARHAELDRFEDANYKEVLKKAAEKKLNRQARVLSSCRYCLENSLLKEHEVLTVNSHFYTLQPNKTSFAGRHVLLVPLDHV